MFSSTLAMSRISSEEISRLSPCWGKVKNWKFQAVVFLWINAKAIIKTIGLAPKTMKRIFSEIASSQATPSVKKPIVDKHQVKMRWRQSLKAFDLKCLFCQGDSSSLKLLARYGGLYFLNFNSRNLISVAHVWKFHNSPFKLKAVCRNCHLLNLLKAEMSEPLVSTSPLRL